MDCDQLVRKYEKAQLHTDAGFQTRLSSDNLPHIPQPLNFFRDNTALYLIRSVETFEDSDDV